MPLSCATQSQVDVTLVTFCSFLSLILTIFPLFLDFAICATVQSVV